MIDPAAIVEGIQDAEVRRQVVDALFILEASLFGSAGLVLGFMVGELIGFRRGVRTASGRDLVMRDVADEPSFLRGQRVNRDQKESGAGGVANATESRPAPVVCAERIPCRSALKEVR